MEYKFLYDNKEYQLNKENCEGIFLNSDNDIEEIENLSVELILSSLCEGNEVNFSKEYYGDKCLCDIQEELNKSYAYLEYHFFIYTKENKYIINTICKDYESTSYNKLHRSGKIDNSYIVSIIVCPCCGNYTIEIEQCTV
ncbi:DUF3785 family protein [Clostridium taeniosporum]|uniref:DUF3785 domain-containing protein n=1 Tax=Clostridium taeniosporum TaxID=394958 RepID=A0A1D7XN12_9CLOT|nr:DUF3785 family protein [Clostridium taeniosporum]AOR24694.1 DUF3785 domain-containing protein [Clostridium taeniosporum]